MKIVISVILSLGVLAPLASAQSLSDGLKQCGQVQNSLKRLVCYDRLVNEMEKYTDMSELMNVPAPLPANGQVVSPAGPDGSASQQQSVQRPPQGTAAQNEPAINSSYFGLEARKIRENSVSEIFSTITSFEKDDKGFLVITLANGMVWKQTETSNLRLTMDQEVHVEKGLFGAHYLGREGVNTRIKVKRIK